MIARGVIVIVVLVAGFVDAVAGSSDADIRSACLAEAKQYCAHALAGTVPFSLSACLAANKDQVSPQCRAVLDAHKL
jgi:hypothetical protein